MDDTGLAQPKTATGLTRLLYVALGCLFVALGVAGVILPGLPATPFFLLASYFFARSSHRLHRWLLTWPVAGELLRDWQRHRGVRLKVKVVALLLLPLAIASSIWFGGLNLYLSCLLVAIGLIGAVVVISLPRVRPEAGPEAAPTPEQPPASWPLSLLPATLSPAKLPSGRPAGPPADGQAGGPTPAP